MIVSIPVGYSHLDGILITKDVSPWFKTNRYNTKPHKIDLITCN